MTSPTVTIMTEVTESGARSMVAELDEFLEFQTEKPNERPLHIH